MVEIRKVTMYAQGQAQAQLRHMIFSIDIAYVKKQNRKQQTLGKGGESNFQSYHIFRL